MHGRCGLELWWWSHTHKLGGRDCEVEAGKTDFLTTLRTGHQSQSNVKPLREKTHSFKFSFAEVVPRTQATTFRRKYSKLHRFIMNTKVTFFWLLVRVYLGFPDCRAKRQCVKVCEYLCQQVQDDPNLTRQQQLCVHGNELETNSCFAVEEPACWGHLIFCNVMWLSSVNDAMEIVFNRTSLVDTHAFMSNRLPWRQLKPFAEAKIEKTALLFHSSGVTFIIQTLFPSETLDKFQFQIQSYENESHKSKLYVL